MTRQVGVVLHSERSLVQGLFDELIGKLSQNGISGIEISSENAELVSQLEMLVVLGGDGTILKAVEIITRPVPQNAEPDDQFGFSDTITEWPNTLL